MTICAVSGMLNGVIGSGNAAGHAVNAAGHPVKVTYRSEETGEDGTILVRERARYTNELTRVHASGETDVSQ